MKYGTLIAFILIISCKVDVRSTKDNLLSCQEVCKGLVDKKIYRKLSNGSVVFNPNLEENTLYEIKCKNANHYYVTDSLKLLIEKSILNNKCKKIDIKQIKSGDTIF